MPSQIITPPDHLPGKNNILIINALETELATLVMWLKTVPEEYNIHIYHSGMVDDIDWVLKVIKEAEYVICARTDNHLLDERIIDLFLAEKKGSVCFFGPNAQYTDLIQFFLEKREKLV